jgi:hypothetical protein
LPDRAETTAMTAAAARKLEELFDVLRIDHRNDHNTPRHAPTRRQDAGGGDPARALQRAAADHRVRDVRVLPGVGCEAIAEHVFDHVGAHIRQESGARVWLESVEVREHEGNSAVYER